MKEAGRETRETKRLNKVRSIPSIIDHSVGRGSRAFFAAAHQNNE